MGGPEGSLAGSKRARRRFVGLLAVSIFQCAKILVVISLVVAAMAADSTSGEDHLLHQQASLQHSLSRRLGASKGRPIEETSGSLFFILALLAAEVEVGFWFIATSIVYLVTRPLCILAAAQYLHSKGNMSQKQVQSLRSIL